MGAPEVTAYLTHLAVQANVAASTQNQALSAILFLYRDESDARGRSVTGIWIGALAARARPQVRDGEPRVGLAMGLSRAYTHVLKRGGLAVKSPSTG